MTGYLDTSAWTCLDTIHQPQAAAAAPAHWMDHLKFGSSTPTFDVLEKTKEYAACETYEEVSLLYADDFVFRGPILGPGSAKTMADTFNTINFVDAYPDLRRGRFGFNIDPENPYRCFFFERWTATNTGELKVGPKTFPATGNQVKTPLLVTSVTWNPKGKVIYYSVSPPIDRFEGNTMGAGAGFGLLYGAGFVGAGSSVGLPMLMLQQKIVQNLGIAPKQWADEADIPAWWKSKARGADPTDI